MDLMTNLKNMDFFSGKLLDPVLKFGYFGVKCGNNNISYNDLLDLENSLDALDVSLEKGFDCDREEV